MLANHFCFRNSEKERPYTCLDEVLVLYNAFFRSRADSIHELCRDTGEIQMRLCSWDIQLLGCISWSQVSGLRICVSFLAPKDGPSWIMQGLGERLPQERLHFLAVIHSRSEVSHGCLSTQLLLISLLTTDPIKREGGSLLFQIVSLNLKNQEISLQS